jgi:hypothetical protein
MSTFLSNTRPLKSLLQLSSALGLSLALTACGGPPSNQQAESAFLTLYNESGATQMTGKPKGIRNFTVSNCVKAEAKEGFVCHTQGELILQVMGKEFPAAINSRARYSKSGGVWRAHQD